MIPALIAAVLAGTLGYLVGVAVERGRRLQRQQVTFATSLRAQVLLSAIDAPHLELTAEEIRSPRFREVTP